MLAASALFGQSPPQGSADAKAVADFQARAKQYIQLREKAAGKQSTTDSPEKLQAKRRELANKIRVARAGAKQGEIFTPEVAEYFRHQIAATLNGPHGNEVRETLRNAEPVKMQLQINISYPGKVPFQSTPPTLLLNLPELPKGLEYRLIDRELILRDTDANIVVDYVPNAWPGAVK